MQALSQAREAGLSETNRRFYDGLWAGARLVEPQRFNTWPLVSELCAQSGRRLEIAPGLRPRLPLQDTVFLDLSAPALHGLRTRGAHAMRGSIGALPFAARSFDLVCAFDIVEHVADDDGAFSELARVTAPDATLLLSVPLHPQAWNAFDEFVGHCRRYEPAAIVSSLATHGFRIDRSAVYGMQPGSSVLLDLGMWFLRRHPRTAMTWYNRMLMPIGLRAQKPLRLVDGMVDAHGVDEVLLVCRKG
ncbi:MAG TPA: methyltransferase domain-containing protein [Rhodanobacteraceae bacterium]|nr:methyltransferase domain-containing protein [Rhodanobacteraceae bacterium]